MGNILSYWRVVNCGPLIMILCGVVVNTLESIPQSHGFESRLEIERGQTGSANSKAIKTGTTKVRQRGLTKPPLLGDPRGYSQNTVLRGKPKGLKTGPGRLSRQIKRKPREIREK
jgi:hypothetical protein